MQLLPPLTFKNVSLGAFLEFSNFQSPLHFPIDDLSHFIVLPTPRLLEGPTSSFLCTYSPGFFILLFCCCYCGHCIPTTLTKSAILSTSTQQNLSSYFRSCQCLSSFPPSILTKSATLCCLHLHYLYLIPFRVHPDNVYQLTNVSLTP